ncbi:hypothetical protein GGG16DRAFT_119139 [Schizophyllum commune]
MTPEQMQAMINFFFQHQPGAHLSPSTTTTTDGSVSTSGERPEQSIDQAAANSNADVAAGDGAGHSVPSNVTCPPTPIKTPPRQAKAAPVPSTPRGGGNRSTMSDVLPSSVASTPSSKMAQLTLEGKKLSATPSGTSVRRSGGVYVSTRKPSLPTGEDPMLIFEEPSFDEHAGADSGEARHAEATKRAVDSDGDPYEGFPEIVTVESAVRALAKHGMKPSGGSKKTVSRRKRNEPTTERWMSTRRTRTSSESSPPPVEMSPKKKARVASPALSPVPSPTFKSTPANTEGVASPFESPDQVNRAEVNALESLLQSVKEGAKIPSLSVFLKKAQTSSFVDTEAACSDEDDDADHDGNLKGFVVDDDVVEYDDDAPRLPDDDDKPMQRKGNGVAPREGSSSDVEIVPTPDKGKARADPPPPSPPVAPVAGPSGLPPASSLEEVPADADARVPASGADSVGSAWRTANRPLTNVRNGLYPGSTPVDSNATVCPPLEIAPGDPVFSWAPFSCATLDDIGYTVDVNDVPGDCALAMSDYQDDGWGMPSIDVVAAAETHVHVENLLRSVKFARQGPFVNESQVDPRDVHAVDVSPPTGTTRYKVVVRESRAPAVSLTPGIVRYWKLDTPSAGPHPVYYICMTPFEGLFDRAVALECMVFGQRELNCNSFNNAIRMTTLPSFDRPSGGAANGKSKPSSSIRRGKAASQGARRGSSFELTTNDVVPVFDARKVSLPQDMSTWHTVLPAFEGVPPRDAVAIVAHTTNMWVGTRSSPPSYNVQYNLVYVVVVGALPSGFV